MNDLKGAKLNSLGLPGEPKDTRIVVAMSGGVDSSVVAGILAREGYDVVGMTLQLYDHGEAVHRKGACCAGQDIHDARRCAEVLGIPHYVLDFEQKFKEQVIDPFAAAYVEGETPIPCVTCNQTVKFADLLEMSKQLGAAAMATGHYITSDLVDEKTGRRGLFRPMDHSRDQSYFLFATSQENVDYLRFPLGHLPKSEVREIAKDLDLIVADKSDSQDICFVPQGKYSDIIAKLRPDAMEEGDIVHLDGRVLGKHKGIIHYTIGQRRGIGIAANDPIYVVHLDRANNRVVVGPREALATHKLHLRDMNWLGDCALEEIPHEGLPVFAKVRSTRPPIEARMFVEACEEGTKVSVDLLNGESGVAPGQACVLYADDSENTRVLGGGFIARSEREATAESQLQVIAGKNSSELALS